MLKLELHAHTSDDPCDYIPHTLTDLVDRAAALGYGALAITLHDRQLDVSASAAYARDRGVLLIQGVERAVQGKHVLLINFPSEAERVRSFDEIAELKKRSNGLVVAPHPFYPAGSCLRHLMNRHADLFDAVEFNAMYTRGLNFNGPAVRWAERHGKTLVGNADVHRLSQLGTTYSLVDADAEADAICEAIRAGRVTVKTRPLGWVRAVTLTGRIVLKVR
ncbi:MAG: PHP domain-containing protein [Acidimicrobiia bacterium]